MDRMHDTGRALVAKVEARQSRRIDSAHDTLWVNINSAGHRLGLHRRTDAREAIRRYLFDKRDALHATGRYALHNGKAI